jgi:hypothetical protein
MKKLILLLLLSSNTFAANLSYCPDKIVCTQKGNINSCEMVGGNPEAWENMWTNGKIQNATYIFQYAMGVYRVNPHKASNQTSCNYFLASGNTVTNINVSLKQSANLIAHATSDTDWMIAGSIAQCMNPNPTAKDCPYNSFDR